MRYLGGCEICLEHMCQVENVGNMIFSNLSSSPRNTSFCKDAVFIVVIYRTLLDWKDADLTPHLSHIMYCSRMKKKISERRSSYELVIKSWVDEKQCRDPLLSLKESYLKWLDLSSSKSWDLEALQAGLTNVLDKDPSSLGLKCMSKSNDFKIRRAACKIALKWQWYLGFVMPKGCVLILATWGTFVSLHEL